MVSALPIVICVVLGVTIVWSDRAPKRGERVTPDEAETYNVLRGL